MNQEQLALFNAFVKEQPVEIIPNPYWTYQSEQDQVISHIKGAEGSLDISLWEPLLRDVREYFKHTYDAFSSEAQVLCVNEDDAEKLHNLHMPSLSKTYRIGDINVVVFVLPQHNSFHVTSVGESFWQRFIVGQDIHPVARIHSHHILDPYQSATDYASLNSNTLEMVIGQIYDDALSICYWLDVRSTLTKNNVWVAIQSLLDETQFAIRKIPCGDIAQSDTNNGTLGTTAGKREN